MKLIFAAKAAFQEYIRLAFAENPKPPPGALYNSRSSNRVKETQSKLFVKYEIAKTLELIVKFIKTRNKIVTGGFGIEIDDILYYLSIFSIVRPKRVLDLEVVFLQQRFISALAFKKCKQVSQPLIIPQNGN
jgi:hypothetical protein